MNRILHMKKSTRTSLFTYTLVIVAYLVIQLLRNVREGGVGSVLEGQLIPICAYVTMALALNLVVGISGELSLGHAGFMSIGAFAGASASAALQGAVESAPLRLALAMLLGALFAGVFGFLIGIPVLRLNGDYLAIVTLAFGEIIKSLVTNIYLGVDENGFQFSFLKSVCPTRELRGECSEQFRFWARCWCQPIFWYRLPEIILRFFLFWVAGASFWQVCCQAVCGK